MPNIKGNLENYSYGKISIYETERHSGMEQTPQHLNFSRSIFFGKMQKDIAGPWYSLETEMPK